MRTYDLSPFWRSTIGFDRLLDLVNDTVDDGDTYPPYDIERTSEDQYRISLALVGFTPDDVAITAERSTLTVEGRKADEDERDYLYRGISVRPFRRVFKTGRLCPGQGRDVRRRPAQDCPGSGSAGSAEAASNRDRCCRQ